MRACLVALSSSHTLRATAQLVQPNTQPLLVSATGSKFMKEVVPRCCRVLIAGRLTLHISIAVEGTLCSCLVLQELNCGLEKAQECCKKEGVAHLPQHHPHYVSIKAAKQQYLLSAFRDLVHSGSFWTARAEAELDLQQRIADFAAGHHISHDNSKWRFHFM